MRQTALLSVMFVLVGMMLLVPITGKAMAQLVARADGKCGTTPCHLTLLRYMLYPRGGNWVSTPTRDGTVVTWSIKAHPEVHGNVEYLAQGEGKAVLVVYKFLAPSIGPNKCDQDILPPVPGLHKSCDKGSSLNARFFYFFELPSADSGSGGSNSGSDSGDDNGGGDDTSGDTP